MTSSGPPRNERPKILVVEDEEDVRRMLAVILAALGEVTTAVDGVDAYVRLTEGYVPDVIVTDLMMPRMDGLTLATKLRANPALARVPVVMLTAKTSARDVVAGINAGARHYVTKPFKTEELVGKVRKALTSRAK